MVRDLMDGRPKALGFVRYDVRSDGQASCEVGSSKGIRDVGI